MNHGTRAHRCLLTHHTPGEGSSDLMPIVTHSGPLPAPPSAPSAQRELSPPHPRSPLHTQQDLGPGAGEEALGAGEESSFHSPKGGQTVTRDHVLHICHSCTGTACWDQL